jgi:hypothetical protein
LDPAITYNEMKHRDRWDFPPGRRQATVKVGWGYGPGRRQETVPIRLEATAPDKRPDSPTPRLNHRSDD